MGGLPAHPDSLPVLGLWAFGVVCVLSAGIQDTTKGYAQKTTLLFCHSEAAESTPLKALALVELGRRAGLSPGVHNIVVGEPKKVGKSCHFRLPFHWPSWYVSEYCASTLLSGSARSYRVLGITAC